MFKKGNKIGHRFTKKDAKEFGSLGGLKTKKIGQSFSDEERKKRGERMRKQNECNDYIRICRYCKKRFRGRISDKYCKKDCKESNMLMKRYNITVEDKRQLFQKQKGLCAICKKRKARDVDHCHQTNKVRGLLCRYCNTSLKFFDDKEIFLKMCTYANKFRKNEVK